MNLLFLGDSLIEYCNWQERFPGHRALNLGAAGESVEGLLSRVVTIRDAVADADMIFIMSGINNVAMGDLEFTDFYQVILEKLSSFYPDAKIFIHSLLPAAADVIPERSIVKMNASLKKLAKECGVAYLDIYKRFTDEKGRPAKGYLLDDGVHVSTRGYRVWAAAIEEIIDMTEKDFPWN